MSLLTLTAELNPIRLAPRIARLKPSVVLSSPLKRAMYPAKEIARAAGVPLKADKHFLPVDLGEMVGAPTKTGEPELARKFREEPDKPIAKGAETPRHFFNAKVKPGFAEVKRIIRRGGRPAIVTHGRNIRQVPHGMFGKKPGDPTKGGPEPGGFETLSGKDEISEFMARFWFEVGRRTSFREGEEMRRLKVLVCSLALALVGLAPVPAPRVKAQNPFPTLPQFGRQYVARNFGQYQERIFSGSTAGGTYTLGMTRGYTITPGGGLSFVPYNVNTPITVGLAGVQETVWPSAVSGCGVGVNNAGSCLVTATFTYAHGQGTPVYSGDYGVQEAIDYAVLQGGGSGDPFAAFGGLRPGGKSPACSKSHHGFIAGRRRSSLSAEEFLCVRKSYWHIPEGSIPPSSFRG